MLEILKEKLIFKLWTSRILVSFSDVFFDLFLSWKVYEQSQKITDVAIILGSSFLVKGLFSFLAGALTDSFNRKKLLVFSDIGSATALLLFLLFYSSPAPHSIIFYTSIRLSKSFFVAIFNNAFTSFIADLSDTQKMIKIQSLFSASNRAISLVGATAAGFLVSVLSFNIAVIFNSFIFILSACIISTIKTPEINILTKRHTSLKLRTISFRKIPFLFQFFYKHIALDKKLLFFCLLIFTLNLVYGYVPYVFPFLLTSKLELGPFYLGLLRSLFACGEILGLIYVGRYGANVSRCFLIGLSGSGFALILVLFKPTTIFVIAAYLLYGTFDAITQPYYSYTISKIDSHIRGRVLGAIDVIILCAAPLGMFLGTFIIEKSFLLGVVCLSSVLLLASIVFFLNPLTKNIVVPNEQKAD